MIFCTLDAATTSVDMRNWIAWLRIQRREDLSRPNRWLFSEAFEDSTALRGNEYMARHSFDLYGSSYALPLSASVGNSTDFWVQNCGASSKLPPRRSWQ